VADSDTDGPEKWEKGIKGLYQMDKEVTGILGIVKYKGKKKKVTYLVIIECERRGSWCLCKGGRDRETGWVVSSRLGTRWFKTCRKQILGGFSDLVSGGVIVCFGSKDN
jgi:hypothetical protein